MKRVLLLLCVMLLLAMPVYAADTDAALMERGYGEAYLNMLAAPQKEKLLEFVEQYDAQCIFVHDADGDKYTPDTVVSVADVGSDTYLVAADYVWREVPESEGEDTYCIVWDSTQFGYREGFAAYDWAMFPESEAWQLIRALDGGELQPEGILYSVFPTSEATGLRGSAYMLLSTHSGATRESANFGSVKAAYFHSVDEELQAEQDWYYKLRGLAIVLALLLPFGFMLGRGMVKASKED